MTEWTRCRIPASGHIHLRMKKCKVAVTIFSLTKLETRLAAVITERRTAFYLIHLLRRVEICIPSWNLHLQRNSKISFPPFPSDTSSGGESQTTSIHDDHLLLLQESVPSSSTTGPSQQSVSSSCSNTRPISTRYDACAKPPYVVHFRIPSAPGVKH